jgi:hypothetical protein
MAGRCMRAVGVAACLVLLFEIPASAAPTATLNSEQKVSPVYGQGLARVKGGWILSGRFILTRVDDKLREKKSHRNPIPKKLASQGYNHVGDIDVAGKYVYAPFEQDNYELGEQVTAWYNKKTLKFVDSVVVKQHENSFVTVDPKTMIAYSFDRFGGQALLRYDIRNDWAPLAPIAMSVFVDKVQGADIYDGYAWLSTTDPTNGLYRVDLETGETVGLGSAGHLPGEGEGIDVTDLKSGLLHTLVIDPKLNPVWLGHFAVSE